MYASPHSQSIYTLAEQTPLTIRTFSSLFDSLQSKVLLVFVAVLLYGAGVPVWDPYRLLLLCVLLRLLSPL